jgi:hypothetical protein
MDDIYYLIHTTDNPDFINWNELKVSDTNSFIYTNEYQFPGIYFSLVTKQNIDYLSLYPGKYILFFSRDLLLQQNYHINFYDHNGMITEYNTFYPWNIDKFLEKQNQYIQNNINKRIRFTSEVVFHNNISLQKLCSYIEKPKLKIDYKVDSIERILNKIDKINTLLPRNIFLNMNTNINTNTNQIPFYCYPFENVYPIETNFKKSSINWFKMIAQMCNIQINENYTIEHIQEKIKIESKNIYNNREKQNLELLKSYTNDNKVLLN